MVIIHFPPRNTKKEFTRRPNTHATTYPKIKTINPIHEKKKKTRTYIRMHSIRNFIKRQTKNPEKRLDPQCSQLQEISARDA